PQVLPRIAILTAASAESAVESGSLPRWHSFFSELRRLGHVENVNMSVDRWDAAGESSRYSEVVPRIIARKPSVIVVDGSNQVVALQAQTLTIPIVGSVTDPLGYGFSSSLARPDKNYTGVTPDAGPEIYGKRMEILRDALPNAQRIGFLTREMVWN